MNATNGADIKRNSGHEVGRSYSFPSFCTTMMETRIATLAGTVNSGLPRSVATNVTATTSVTSCRLLRLEILTIANLLLVMSTPE